MAATKSEGNKILETEVSSKNILGHIKLHQHILSFDKINELETLRKHIRPTVQWKKEEVQALLKGVNEYGESHWIKILNKYKDVFNPSRRVIDIVDKYNQIKKRTSYYTAQKKNWVEISRTFVDKTDEMGQCIIFTAKFPFYAANNIIKRQKKSQLCLEGEILIRNYDDEDDIHMYKYNRVNGKLKLKKLAYTKRKGNAI